MEFLSESILRKSNGRTLNRILGSGLLYIAGSENITVETFISVCDIIYS